MMSQVQPKQSSQSPEDYPNDNDYGYGDDSESEFGEDLYSDSYEPTMDEGSPQPIACSATELRSQLSHLNELLKTTQGVEGRGKISAEIKSLEKKINAAVGISNEEKQAAEFSSIMAVISHVEAEILGKPEGFSGEEGMEGIQGLKSEIEKALKDIDGRKNLTDDEKVELKAPLEKDLAQIKLAKDDDSKVDPDQIRSNLEEAKTNADEQDAYSPAIKGLQKATEMEPEVIQGKAKAAGIDLGKLTSPPSPEELKKTIEFLAKITPELKEQFQKVEDAINERNQYYEKLHTTAAGISKANHASTTDQDTTDLSSWQELYDCQFHQDDDDSIGKSGKSGKVVKAVKAAMASLEPMLKALFGEKAVKQVEVSGLSGWQKKDQEYKVADQIIIGTTTFDLFNNTDGKLQTATTPDPEKVWEIPLIWSDGEGDGEWSAKAAVLQMTTYDAALPIAATYDDSDGNPIW